MDALYDQSIRIILDNQHPSGAYVASPNFDTYRYCWFRDGAFIAYAMDMVGEHGSAERFHQWSTAAVNRRADVIGRAVAKAHAGEKLASTDLLHTRYSLVLNRSRRYPLLPEGCAWKTRNTKMALKAFF